MLKDISLDLDQYSVIHKDLTFSSVIKQTNKEILEQISIVRILIVSIVKVAINHGKNFQEVKMDTPF